VESGVALLAEETCVAFIVALDGSFDVTLGSTIRSLQVLDTLMLEATQDLILLSGTGRAILVEIALDQPESLHHDLRPHPEEVTE
jgi:hypothetical protein